MLGNGESHSSSEGPRGSAERWGSASLRERGAQNDGGLHRSTPRGSSTARVKTPPPYQPQRETATGQTNTGTSDKSDEQPTIRCPSCQSRFVYASKRDIMRHCQKCRKAQFQKAFTCQSCRCYSCNKCVTEAPRSELLKDTKRATNQALC